MRHLNNQPETRLLRLFVYGTLKRGYWNHDRYCREAVSIQEASVRGRLYELPSGIPVLQVPDEDVLAVGTQDARVDVRTQNSASVQAALILSTDWRMIRGEMVTFANGFRSLPPIDRLEGFRPGHSCPYTRVLVPTMISGATVAAWCYASCTNLSQGARRLHTCRWHVSNRYQ